MHFFCKYQVDPELECDIIQTFNSLKAKISFEITLELLLRLQLQM